MRSDNLDAESDTHQNGQLVLKRFPIETDAIFCQNLFGEFRKEIYESQMTVLSECQGPKIAPRPHCQLGPRDSFTTSRFHLPRSTFILPESVCLPFCFFFSCVYFYGSIFWIKCKNNATSFRRFHRQGQMRSSGTMPSNCDRVSRITHFLNAESRETESQAARDAHFCHLGFIPSSMLLPRFPLSLSLHGVKRCFSRPHGRPFRPVDGSVDVFWHSTCSKTRVTKPRKATRNQLASGTAILINADPSSRQ